MSHLRSMDTFMGFKNANKAPYPHKNLYSSKKCWSTSLKSAFVGRCKMHFHPHSFTTLTISCKRALASHRCLLLLISKPKRAYSLKFTDEIFESRQHRFKPLKDWSADRRTPTLAALAALCSSRFLSVWVFALSFVPLLTLFVVCDAKKAECDLIGWIYA